MSSGTATGNSNACGKGVRARVIPHLYSRGDVLFACYKANKGIIEKVVIQCIRFNRKLGQFIPLYVDTFNGLWNEEELCLEGDARAAVTLYQIIHEAFLESAC